MLRTNVIIFFVVLLFEIFISTVSAQQFSNSLAVQVPVNSDVQVGDVLCANGDLFSKCSQEYQTSIYGVAVESSLLEIRDTEIENAMLVATSGLVDVKVTSKSGPIKKGSLLTSSALSGFAELAIKNGYVLGTATEDFVGGDSEEGVIQVAINIHPSTGVSRTSSSNLIEFIRQGLTVPVFEPLESFRYLLAGVMVVVAFTLGLAYFGKSSRAGIEAIGRNPLAKNVIQFTTVLNVLLTIVIVSVGLIIAYFILVF